jgi:hypothetical protein
MIKDKDKSEYKLKRNFLEITIALKKSISNIDLEIEEMLGMKKK